MVVAVVIGIAATVAANVKTQDTARGAVWLGVWLTLAFLFAGAMQGLWNSPAIMLALTDVGLAAVLTLINIKFATIVLAARDEIARAPSPSRRLRSNQRLPPRAAAQPVDWAVNRSALEQPLLEAILGGEIDQHEADDDRQQSLARQQEHRQAGDHENNSQHILADRDQRAHRCGALGPWTRRALFAAK